MGVETDARTGAERPRILLIDDDEALRDSIAESLRDDYAVASVPHSAAALELLRIHQPALILLDLRMPVMDGWSFVEQYRRSAVASAKIVVMSAAPDLPTIARQLGADAYVRKPFDIQELHMVLFAQLSVGAVPGQEPDLNEQDAAQAVIDRVCVRRDHFEVGRGRPDGTGHLTLVGREWAYCSAALAAEKHVWQRTGGVVLDALSHDVDWLARGAPAPHLTEGQDSETAR